MVVDFIAADYKSSIVKALAAEAATSFVVAIVVGFSWRRLRIQRQISLLVQQGTVNPRAWVSSCTTSLSSRHRAPLRGRT